MHRIISSFCAMALAAFAAVTTAAAQVVVPPSIVTQPDGTLRLVPVPPATVYTPYVIDPSIKYRLVMESGWSNADWQGKTRNGQVALKDREITVDLMAMPLTRTAVIDGKTVTLFSVFRSADVCIGWDNTKLELLPLGPQGTAFDASVFNGSKSRLNRISPAEGEGSAQGVAVLHAEVLPPPQERTPALRPDYYRWNMGGFLWQGGYRLVAKLRFRVRDDFYYPVQSRTDIRILPTVSHGGVEYATKIDGSPTKGTNVLGETRSSVNGILFGVGPEYRVTHSLVAPAVKAKVGDIVPVKVLVSSETKPQRLHSVATNFAWDPSKLEFMGISTTGSLSFQQSNLSFVGAGNINEATVPKDGTAAHNWLCRLGTRTVVTGGGLVATLNFKVVSEFDTAAVEILGKDDPRLVGVFVLDESGILGSDIPGVFVTGTKVNAVVRGPLSP